MVALVDWFGNVAAVYTYDAWGNPLSVTGSLASTIGVWNPLRYRGYVYDTETGLYYLQSRYYNPEIGRFLNADGLISTGQGFLGNNMFAYSLNNPISLQDPSGRITISSLILIASVIAGVVAAGYTAYKEYQAGYEPVQIIGDSFCAGISAFSIIYSGGTSLYECYQRYCYLHGITPITSVGPSVMSPASTVTIPNAANATLSYVDHNGRAPQGYKGGKEFLNDGRNGGQILPQEGMPYYEYDIYPNLKGRPRGMERIVVGSDGSAWYTADHYNTFYKMR